MVMIGIDPHKRTHTAVAVDDRRSVLGEQLVPPRVGQVGELVAWADRLDGAADVGDRVRGWARLSVGAAAPRRG